MSIGPVEYIAIAFPGNKFSGQIVPAIKELQDSGPSGSSTWSSSARTATATSPASSLPRRARKSRRRWPRSASRAKNLLGQEDVEDIGAALDPNSTAALMIWENVWAARFAQSLRDADGILIANGRIPVQLVEELMAESVS